jgi:ABC-type multidrug transport system ATPase subunit
LTGLFPPISGDCIIYGRSIVDDLQEARQSIGICPQHNVLFDCLTVSEHLAFFMRIKGIRPNSAKVRSHAEEIGLTDYISTTSSALSGGNKRKLSVAIALSGDPSVLVLDEPTSAMDPHSRRAVWELLRAKRKGRVTLLTTHFMDEAELLSDRIAVMKEGKLQCCGSALFLKARFGLGYNLTVVLEPSESSSDEEAGYQNLLEVKPKESCFFSQRDRLAEFLKERIPNTQLVRTSGKEVTFRFPQGTESLFPAAFDALEVERNSLGVGAYGIQNSSLEEVFLQLADDEDAGSSDEHKNDPQGEHTQADAEPVHPIEETGDVTQVRHGHLSPLHQIGLLYTKRFIIQKRDIKGAFCTIILPVLVVALVLLILMVEPPFVGPGIELNPSLYKTSSVGGDSETGIVVGGVSPVTSTSSIVEEFLRFSESVQQQYEYTDFIFNGNATTSADVSRYLLDTYNDRDHPPRFGAYALNDVIKVAVRTSWDDIRESMKSTSGPSGDYNQTSLDLLKTFSLGDSNGKMRWNVSVSEIADWIYDSTLLSPRSSFDAVSTVFDFVFNHVVPS